jgi:hypothetical protein
MRCRIPIRELAERAGMNHKTAAGMPRRFRPGMFKNLSESTKGTKLVGVAQALRGHAAGRHEGLPYAPNDLISRASELPELTALVLRV